MSNVSDCCGAPDGCTHIKGPSWSDIGICPDCRDHCEFVEEDDKQIDPAKLYDIPCRKCQGEKTLTDETYFHDSGEPSGFGCRSSRGDCPECGGTGIDQKYGEQLTDQEIQDILTTNEVEQGNKFNVGDKVVYKGRPYWWMTIESVVDYRYHCRYGSTGHYAGCFLAEELVNLETTWRTAE